jgi:hypothetical protein
MIKTVLSIVAYIVRQLYLCSLMWKGQLRGTSCIVTYSNTIIAFHMIFICLFFSIITHFHYENWSKESPPPPPPLPQVMNGHIRINLVRPWIQERKFNNKILLL